MEMIFYIY